MMKGRDDNTCTEDAMKETMCDDEKRGKITIKSSDQK